MTVLISSINKTVFIIASLGLLQMDPYCYQTKHLHISGRWTGVVYLCVCMVCIL